MTGRSQDDQGVRHGLSTPWQPRQPVRVPVAAHMGGGKSFIRDEDHHRLRVSLQCTGEHQLVPTPSARPLMQEQYCPNPSPAMTECSQPPSVQSTTCSAVEEEEETYSTTAPVVTLPNSMESEQAVKVYADLCSSMNGQELCVGFQLPVYGKQAPKHQAKFVEVDTNGLKLDRGHLCVPFRVPFPCKSLCCVFYRCGL